MVDLQERLSSALGDRYAIQSEIGRGGMATVFLAEDLKHHRQVAIKVLHPELTATLGAERFLHEIEIIAGLQHPHILPLHDSGESDGLLYFVMPYVEGESLRQRLDREKQLAVDESVRIAIEVADGLDYAHRQGVVHRDIKPANILLSDRHAVIADFGIARAVEAAQQERITRTGLGVGTPLYASPEQATAEETLDGRTDVYSLGCVLYEMLAGEPPFTGATQQAIQAQRMSVTPSPLHGLRNTVPPALDHAIARALARIPADRYATASQFAQALQAVLMASTPTLSGDLSATPAAVPMTPTAVTTEPAPVARRWWLLAIPILAMVLIAVLWSSDSWFSDGPLEITTSNLVQVTNAPGIEFQPALSPSGTDVAYVVGPLFDAHMEVRNVSEAGSSGAMRPAQAEEGRSVQWLPEWTRDGMSVRLRSCEFAFQWLCEWRQVGKYGGASRTLAIRLGYPDTLRSYLPEYVSSPDGSRVVFSVGDSIFAATDPAGERELLGVHTVDPYGPHSFAWSPDGRWVAYVNGNPLWRFSVNVSGASIWILDARGGEPIRITDGESLNVSPQWLPDSRHLLFVSDREGPRGVYVVEVTPEGSKRSPKNIPGPSDPHSISLSSDGKRIAWAKLTVSQNIWSVPIPDSGSASISAAVPVTDGNRIIEDHDLSRDGEWLVFDSSIRGRFGIYKRRLRGGNAEVVTEVNGHAFGPIWSPDGTEVAFFSLQGSEMGQVFVAQASGGSPRQLTDFRGFASGPAWSRDGLTIAFHSSGPEGDESLHVWTLSRDGPGLPWGDPARLTDFPCSSPDWSPDGSGLVCDGLSAWAIFSVSRTGEVLARYPMQGGFATPRYSPDGSRIYFWCYSWEGSVGICWIPAGGGEVTKVVTLDDPTKEVVNIFQAPPLTVGPDNLYVTISEYDSDIWVADLEW
ncbi:MAG: serine/threonine-protein kinase [marine benthic group bacterium]|jgi:serine/threonine protein kinase/dipeptidyl aminopeptidase/acylaminoacyl peptidase|nr:serine/threonine-protein kinase [Gemmatimonadota bacterium]